MEYGGSKSQRLFLQLLLQPFAATRRITTML
jgi:hypothetical protein